jgi:hypothetical protein
MHKTKPKISNNFDGTFIDAMIYKIILFVNNRALIFDHNIWGSAIQRFVAT